MERATSNTYFSDYNRVNRSLGMGRADNSPIFTLFVTVEDYSTAVAWGLTLAGYATD